MNYLKTRFRERLDLIYSLRDSSIENQEAAKKVLNEYKESGDESLIKEFKKHEFLNNIKFVEIDRNLPILVELYALAKLEGIDLELTEEEVGVMETTKARFTPLFQVDKGKPVFINPEIEKSIMDELNNPSETTVEAMKNILKQDGQK